MDSIYSCNSSFNRNERYKSLTREEKFINFICDSRLHFIPDQSIRGLSIL